MLVPMMISRIMAMMVSLRVISSSFIATKINDSLCNPVAFFEIHNSCCSEPPGCAPRGRTPPGCERPPRRTKHPSAPAAERYRPFSFFRRSRHGVAGGRRGGRARSRTSGGRLRAGGLGWYAPSGLSFPLRFACGPLPLTRPSGSPAISDGWGAQGGHAILGPLPLRLLCPPGCPSVFS